MFQSETELQELVFLSSWHLWTRTHEMIELPTIIVIILFGHKI